MHLDHKNYLDQDYWDLFESVMRDDICKKQNYFSTYD